MHRAVHPFSHFFFYTLAPANRASFGRGPWLTAGDHDSGVCYVAPLDVKALARDAAIFPAIKKNGMF